VLVFPMLVNMLRFKIVLLSCGRAHLLTCRLSFINA